MITNRNNTMMPPTYRITWTPARNSAFKCRYSPATPNSVPIKKMAHPRWILGHAASQLRAYPLHRSPNLVAIQAGCAHHGYCEYLCSQLEPGVAPPHRSQRHMDPVPSRSCRLLVGAVVFLDAARPVELDGSWHDPASHLGGHSSLRLAYRRSIAASRGTGRALSGRGIKALDATADVDRGRCADRNIQCRPSEFTILPMDHARLSGLVSLCYRKNRRAIEDLILFRIGVQAPDSETDAGHFFRQAFHPCPPLWHTCT